MEFLMGCPDQVEGGGRCPPPQRLMHHAHVRQTSGDSIRLTQAIAGKGVSSLADSPTSNCVAA